MATADQTVSAVLEATNKAYILEQDTVEDDTWKKWFVRWSDGRIEQWGVKKTANQGNAEIIITFPVAFSDTNYSAFVENRHYDSDTYELRYESPYGLETTQMKTWQTSRTNQGQGLSFYVCGY